MGEGLFAASGFTRVAIGEHIEVATIDNVAEYEIGGDDNNVAGDVGGDLPDVFFELFGTRGSSVHFAVPWDETEDGGTVAIGGRRSIIRLVGRRD